MGLLAKGRPQVVNHMASAVSNLHPLSRYVVQISSQISSTPRLAVFAGAHRATERGLVSASLRLYSSGTGQAKHNAVVVIFSVAGRHCCKCCGRSRGCLTYSLPHMYKSCTLHSQAFIAHEGPTELVYAELL